MAEPTTPTKGGYVFVGWDYDFAKPVTQDTFIKGVWTPNPGFENFEFEYKNGECTITGLIDRTVTELVIPQGVTSIGSSAFYYCSRLTSVKYRGTEAQWNAITKGDFWNSYTGNYTIIYNYKGD